MLHLTSSLLDLTSSLLDLAGLDISHNIQCRTRAVMIRQPCIPDRLCRLMKGLQLFQHDRSLSWLSPVI